jgi:SAM-dependent methyltransferase/uncharacterized protein YbaR (Trm112 family)
MAPAEDLNFLRCPVTKQDLKPVSNEMISEINKDIKNKKYFYYDGRAVEDVIESGFFNKDLSLLYPVKDEIIFLLNNFAIVIKKENLPDNTKANFYKDAVMNFYDDIGWKKEPDKNFTDARLFEDLRDVSESYIKDCRLRIKKYIPESGKYILDVASGPVQYEEYLTFSENYKYRICVDISYRALQQAREKIGEKGIFILGDITNLPVRDNTIDAVISLHTIYHVPKDLQAEAIREIHRILIPGSKAVIVYSWGWNSVLMNVTIFPVQVYRAFSRIFRVIRRQMIKNKIIDSTPGLYYHSHNYKWIKDQNFPFEIELKSWRSLHTHFLKFWIHKPFLGKKILNFFWKLEEKYPELMGKIGTFPMFIIKK